MTAVTVPRCCQPNATKSEIIAAVSSRRLSPCHSKITKARNSKKMEEDSSIKQLQDFLATEREKAEFTAQIHEFSDFCWDKCVQTTGNKLDSKTETCLTNCVNRFIDVSLFITNRFAQLLEKRMKM